MCCYVDFAAESEASVDEHGFDLHMQIGEDYSHLPSSTSLQQISRMVRLVEYS